MDRTGCFYFSQITVVSASLAFTGANLVLQYDLSIYEGHQH